MTNTVDTKPFEWTDELVKEFLNEGERYKYNWEKEINDFKQTKSIPNKQDEKIRISDFRGDRIYKDPRITDTIYLFNSSKDIPKDKFPAIKQAIESVLNNDTAVSEYDKLKTGVMSQMDMYLMGHKGGVKYGTGIPIPSSQQKYYSQSEVDTIREQTWEAAREFYGYDAGRFDNVIYKTLQDYLNSLSKPSTTPIEDKGWKILTWMDGRTDEVMALISGGIEGNLKAGHKIRSVRRTSDNEVFTVGKFNNGKKIEKFYIGWSGMEIHYTDGSGSLLLEEPFLPQQPPPKTQDKGNVLFTEDGVQIKDKRQLVYHVTDDFKITFSHASTGGIPGRNFSSPEAAEQYILENKPCLSLSDLQKEWFMEDEQVQFGKWEGIPMYRRFQQIVKKKLNQRN